MKKRIISSLSALLCIALLLPCASCMRIKATELSAGYERTTTEPGKLDAEFIAAAADCAFKMFGKTITKDEDNDLFSPLSALLCLGMIANGANGETLAQLEELFGTDLAALNRGLYAYVNSLYSGKNCEVSIANSVWFLDDPALTVKESFLRQNADWYSAQVYKSPFDRTTVSDINSWVNKNTDGMIDKIIDEIPGDALMYLINALCFDAKWLEKYEKDDISDGIFTNYDKSEANVKYLNSEEGTWLCGEGATGFAKSYIGGKYSFVGLLPDEGVDVYDFAQGLTGEEWLSLWNNRTSEEVKVKIPEFSYYADMKLKDVLTSLGVSDMFDGSADFSALGEYAGGNIYCSEVNQKTFIQVDRNGTKAAAITWGMKCGEGAPAENPKTVYLTRPFVYLIVDNTGLPLFTGVVSRL